MNNNKSELEQVRNTHYSVCMTSPKEYWETIKVRTISEAVNSDSPSIVLMKKNMGEMKLAAFLTLTLTELVMSFNIGKTMNDAQIVFAVRSIQDDYYFLKPTELRYCFDKAKKGGYGKVYDRIDLSIIYEWIEEYMSERMGEVETQRHNERNEHIKNNKAILENLVDMLDLSYIGKSDIKPPNEPEPKREGKQYELHQKWFKEWDKLDKLDNAGRFADYKGKVLDQQEFINAKEKELNK